MRTLPTKIIARASAGITLVETVIGATILATIMVIVTGAIDRSQGAWSSASSTDELHTQARRALDAVAEDLSEAVRASLAPNALLADQSTDTLDFRGNAGWAGGAVVLGDLTRLSLELDPAELDNGLDDDDDGLIDERELVWRRDPGAPDEQRSVRTRWVAEMLEGETLNGADDNGNGLVDESGFCIEINGDTLTLRLTLERFSPDGLLSTSTVETSVLIRN